MPDRAVIRIFDQAGVEQVRLGDISNQPWGGSGHTLPAGTFGLWGRRDATWIKGMTQMFYSNTGFSPLVTRTFSDTTMGGSGQGRMELRVREAFPFGTIRVPVGRIVTVELFFHYLDTFEWQNTSNVWANPTHWPPPADTKFIVKLRTWSLVASLNGGAVVAYNTLVGPATSGENAYSSVALDLVMSGSQSAGNVIRGLRTRYYRTVRMFSHEINADPTWTGDGHSILDGDDKGIPGIDAREGINVDQGEGAGSDSGGYQGGIGGGGNPIV